MSRTPISTWYFALVVVRRGHRFLLVQETKYGQAWSIPGGRVEQGETLAEAAIRETLEEAGVPISLDGILRIEHTPRDTDARMRIIFSGTQLDDAPPKEVADGESLRAAYVTLDEIRRMALRGHDLLELLESVASGRTVYPLELLGRELSV